jgi:CheY-like chemotaxis protein
VYTVVDDDPAVHFIATPILIKEGYDVVSAKHGEQGLQLALNQRPDLIILDVIMPGIKGRDLCMKIKSYDVLKSIPVIFLTAKDSDDDIRAELDAGAVTHLTKPIDSKQLISVVKGILGS